MLSAEDVDGRTLIDDGCSTVVALLQLREEHRAGNTVTDQAIVSVFEQGLRVTVVEYQDNDDMATRRSWNVGKHDEEGGNTVRWSSVHMKILVAKDRGKAFSLCSRGGGGSRGGFGGEGWLGLSRESTCAFCQGACRLFSRPGVGVGLAGLLRPGLGVDLAGIILAPRCQRGPCGPVATTASVLAVVPSGLLVHAAAKWVHAFPLQELHGHLGDWGKVAQELTGRFGFSASTTKRWSRAASGMDAEVLALLGTEDYERVKGSAIWDNEFLMGQGVKARSRLEVPSAKVALKVLLDHELGAKTFQEKVCVPLKVFEMWDKLNRKKFGSVCILSSAYARLVAKLQTYEGLQLVHAVMQTGGKLNGTSKNDLGIADCYALVKEFERCKAGGLPPPSRVPTQEELAQEAAAKKKAKEEQERAAKAAQEEAEAKAAKAAQEEELEQGWLPMGTPLTANPPWDPMILDVPDAAEAALEADLQKVRFFCTPEALAGGAADVLASCSRATVVIAAPTSGWQVINNYMSLAQELFKAYKTGGGGAGCQHKFRIVLLVGGRFDIISKVQEKARTLFPASAAFITVLQRSAGQTWTRRPSYVITLAERADCTSPVPTVIVLGRASAKIVVQESLALRCNREECSMCDARASEPEIDADDRDANSMEL